MEIKGILHCHSTYSYDAKLSLRELKDLFKAEGMHFVCMTEHTDMMTVERADAFVKECEALSDETFRFIPGFEIPYKRTHVLMIGARNFCGNFAPTGEELATWAREAKFIVLAHPVRNNFSVDATLLAHLDGLEVWNQQYEGKRVPRTRSIKLFKDLKTKKPELVATGGLDLHRKEHNGTPNIIMDVVTLTEDNIIEKLRTGAFTISSDRAHMYGTLPNVDEIIKKYFLESAFSVAVIVLGKTVSKTCASLGITLPAWLRRGVRSRL